MGAARAGMRGLVERESSAMRNTAAALQSTEGNGCGGSASRSPISTVAITASASTCNAFTWAPDDTKPSVHRWPTASSSKWVAEHPNRVKRAPFT